MKLETQLAQYFDALHKTARRGDAREESFYPDLQRFVTMVSHHQGHAEIQVTVNPRPTEGGNPDFRVWDGSQRVVGYLEAKPPGSDLTRASESEQLERYRRTFPNLILTDFCEFWLFREGDLVEKVRAGQALVLTKLGGPPPAQNPSELDNLLTQFLGFSLPRSFDAQTLARELARRTRFLDRIVLAQLRVEQKAKKGRLRGFFLAFRQFLISHLREEQFADLYAQTISYGLFAARTRAGEDFNRRNAVGYIPRTIGVLHDVFEFLSWGDLPEDLAWIVDDLAHVLATADAQSILDRYYKDGKGADPIVHFYETFLAEYDPQERERRGVYYTPEPVVGYIVRSLHQLLGSEFKLAGGLAAKGVTVLDPAAGTMTFVARAAEQAVNAFVERYGDGGRETFIRDRVLPNFYGFELMMAPYAVGHLKMGFFLEELGHKLRPNERFQLYLTNSLEMEKTEQSDLPGMAALADEAEHAHRVKQQVPILVVLGNPPYSGHSANTGEWIRGLIDDYKKSVPELSKPGQAKWLHDDYVKFIRFAEWKISQADHGIVGIITNHSWLDNPTFRGMRRHLMETFDEIRVLDLHGSALKKETTPEGESDENVFDIRQGVAISFFLRRQSTNTGAAEKARMSSAARVLHAEIWGAREAKYGWLVAHDVADTQWTELAPQEPFYVFRPVDRTGQTAYRSFPSVSSIFSPNGDPAPGIVTTQDEFAISWTAEEAAEKVQRLLLTRTEEEARQQFRLCSQSQWNYERAKSELASGSWREQVVPILYRPFDKRWTVFNRNVAVHRRERVMRHMLAGDNLSLCIGRAGQVVGSGTWNLAYCTEHIEDFNLFYRGGNVNFPLYLYSGTGTPENLFSDQERSERRLNLHASLLPILGTTYGRTVAADEVLFYIYAILYAPSYRRAFADFLKIDFPRIPFAANNDTFTAMVDCGRRLVALHLLKSPELHPPRIRFTGQGSNRVATTKSEGLVYHSYSERMNINATDFFGPISPDLWEYRIGGYQVLDKWLKDRKGRELSTDEVQTYCHITTALLLTKEIQTELDVIYPEIEEALLVVELKS